MLRLRSYLSALVVVSTIALLPGTLIAQADSKVDVTGKWRFTVTTGAGTGTPSVTLKQQGDSISGHYSSQVLGERDLKGTIKDSMINFAFDAEVQGTQLLVKYSGRVEADGTLKGDVDLGGQATGTFTAARVPQDDH